MIYPQHLLLVFTGVKQLFLIITSKKRSNRKYNICKGDWIVMTNTLIDSLACSRGVLAQQRSDTPHYTACPCSSTTPNFRKCWGQSYHCGFTVACAQLIFFLNIQRSVYWTSSCFLFHITMFSSVVTQHTCLGQHPELQQSGDNVEVKVEVKWKWKMCQIFFVFVVRTWQLDVSAVSTSNMWQIMPLLVDSMRVFQKIKTVIQS